jgi:hypothetical protein
LILSTILVLSGYVDIIRILGGVGSTAVGTRVLEAGEVNGLHVVERVALVGVPLAADVADKECGAALGLAGDVGV